MNFSRWGQRLCSLLPLFLLVLLGTSKPPFAQFQIPEKPDGYVTDHAALLSVAVKQQLEEKLRAFESATSNQVVVAIFPEMDGGSLEDISIRMATQWKIGQKGRNNGVLFLIFRDDHQMRIEVGYGLEGVLTDAVSSQIIRRIVVPQFRNGNFEQGIMDGVNAIFAATQGEYQALPEKQDDGSAATLKVFFGIIFAILAIDFIRYGIYAGQHKAYKSRYTFWEWFFLFAIFWMILRAILTSRGSSNWSSGGRGGGYSGGGFSGGGGSFGGGGSSGRW